MDYLLLAFFVGFMIVAAIGNYGERSVILRRLSLVRGEKVKAAWTNKRRLELLGSYKVEYLKGEEDFWYKYLNYVYEKSKWFIPVATVLAVLALLF